MLLIEIPHRLETPATPPRLHLRFRRLHQEPAASSWRMAKRSACSCHPGAPSRRGGDRRGRRADRRRWSAPETDRGPAAPTLRAGSGRLSGQPPWRCRWNAAGCIQADHVLETMLTGLGAEVPAPLQAEPAPTPTAITTPSAGRPKRRSTSTVMTGAWEALALVALRLASPTPPVGATYSRAGVRHRPGLVKTEAQVGEWIADARRRGGRLRVAAAGAFEVDAWAAGDDGPGGRANTSRLASRETAELRAETVQMGYSLVRLLCGSAGLRGLPWLGGGCGHWKIRRPSGRLGGGGGGLAGRARAGDQRLRLGVDREHGDGRGQGCPPRGRPPASACCPIWPPACRTAWLLRWRWRRKTGPFPARPRHRQQPPRNPVFATLPLLRCPAPKPSPASPPPCLPRLAIALGGRRRPHRLHGRRARHLFPVVRALRARKGEGRWFDLLGMSGTSAVRSRRRWSGVPRPTGRGPKAPAGCCATGTATRPASTRPASRPCGGAEYFSNAASQWLMSWQDALPDAWQDVLPSMSYPPSAVLSDLIQAHEGRHAGGGRTAGGCRALRWPAGCGSLRRRGGCGQS